jgi:hypothetical protein
MELWTRFVWGEMAQHAGIIIIISHAHAALRRRKIMK